MEPNSRKIARDLRLPLQWNCYCKKFLALIQCEEEEHHRLLREKCNGTYHIDHVSKKEQYDLHLAKMYAGYMYFSIHGMSPRQILYASQASGSVSIKCSNDTVEAEIVYLSQHYDVSNDVLYIRTTRSDTQLIDRTLRTLQGKGFEMKFNVKPFYFKNLREAIENLSDETIRRIVPSKRYFLKCDSKLEWIPRSRYYRHQLDSFQFKALKTILFCDLKAPALVPGPFGTGKTRLLSVACEYLITRAKEERIPARILLCCHQQNSADLFMEDYFMKMRYFSGSVVRVTSQIHHRQDKRTDNSICETVTCGNFIKNIDHYRPQNRIVIVTTYLTALNMHHWIGQDYFTHIFIDEGAQAREPECIAPLGMAGDNTRIIIVGDSQQVGPKLVVLGEDAQKNGLGVSLLERLHRRYKKIPNAKAYYTATLRNNYRCVPDILTLSSDLFYNSSLKPRSIARAIKGKPPLQFICSSLSGSEMVGCECQVEAQIVIEELRKLLFDHKICSSRICVMSPSQRQISLINKERKQKKLPWVKTLSTYQMQGQEFDILILSAVESTFSNGMPFDPLKSLCHPAIFNTAITRARSLIIVIGNPTALKRGEKAINAEPRECWKTYISACRAKRTYRDASHPVTTPTFPNPRRRLHVYDDLAIYQKSASVSSSVTKSKTNSSPIISPPQLKKKVVSNDCSSVSNTTASVSNKKEPTVQYESPSTEKVVVERQHFKHKHRPLNQKLLEEKLTRQNYKEKFHQLLCREEDEHERILRDRCDGIYELHLDDRSHRECAEMKHVTRKARYHHIRFGYITADHLDGDKVAYAEQASEGKLIVTFEFGAAHRGEKIELELDMVTSCIFKDLHSIVLGLKEPHRKYFGMVYLNAKVTFILKYSYFDRFHQALDNLLPPVLKKILPESPNDFGVLQRPNSDMSLCPEVKPFVWLDDAEQSGQVRKKLVHQRFSLQTILRSDPLKSPVLIVGSFGTGKTRLLARAAYQILHNSSRTKTRCNVLVCAHHQKSVDTFMENYFGKMIKNSWSIGDGVIPIRLVPNERYDVPCKSLEKYYMTINKIKKIPKHKLKLVLSTYSSCTHLKFLKKWHFTHLLLDEGAQTREPETILPLSLVDEKASIVIAGDHKQVGPSILVLGEAPRKYGLKYSLLERLHTLYHEDGLRDASKDHCATLLMNFRSHHALLSLPSYLFYGSALVTVAKASNQVHPGVPHSLKFICSSLDDSVVQVNSSTNDSEISLILNQVQEYVQKCPGQLKKNDFCIMATTPDQKSRFSQKINGYKGIKSFVKILTVYDMQGREFQAIFLSTAEPITEQGKPKNPTKSPCGQYVFNTAITRAKSHVVCAGNPFLLMKVEKTMENVDNEKSFWKDYFRRCIVTKSFIVPAEIENQPEELEKLQKTVFGNDSKICNPLNCQVSSDSIMKRLEDQLAKRNKVKECKFQIQEQSREYYSANWELLEVEGNGSQSNATLTSNTVSGEKMLCDLEIKTSRRAIAIPQKAQQEPIVINGFHNRQGAFNGDVVEVGLIGNDEEGTKYGMVTQVKEYNHPMKYVCTADSKDVIFFYPIDKKVPSIVNLPKISRSILHHKPEELNELQREYIVIFDESSLNAEDLSLKIKELVPLSMGPSLFFVVKVLNWSPKFRKPLGAVIEALPRTNNLFITEKLLSIAHDIPLHDSEVEKSSHDDAWPQDESNNVCRNDVVKAEYRNAITIDPEEAVNFDDAVTIIPLDESNTAYELAVLIIDATEYVTKGSELDEIAKQRGTSVYPGHQTGCSMIPMLPSDFTQSKLSLSEKGGIRPVIVVSAKVKMDDTGDVVDSINGVTVKKSTLGDPVNLTYNSAQFILNGEELCTELKEKESKFNSSNAFSLKNTLHLLLKVAWKLRINRLRDAAYNYRVSDPEEERSWQAHLLVEELMIWANSEIAKYIINESPNVCVLRNQPPPLDSDLSDFCNTHCQLLGFSLSLKEILSHNQQPLKPVTEKGLLLTSDIVEKLEQAYHAKNTREFVRILSQESNFSQLSIIQDALFSISQRARYSFINPASKELITNHYKHYGIGLLYTHFSSPIRRYIDMIVHRIAKALLNKEDMPYQEEELMKLCQDLDLKTRNANRYSKNIDRARSALKWEEEGMKKTVGYVTTSMYRKKKFHLCFQDGLIDEFMMRDDSTFDYSDLNYHSKDDQGMITWQVMSVPLKDPSYLTECPLLSTRSHGDGQVKVKVYPFKGEGRCHKEHLLSIVNNNRVIPLKEWQLAHECVKNPKTQENIENFYKRSLFGVEDSSAKDELAIQTEDKHQMASFNEDACSSPLIQYSVNARLDIGYPVNAWIGKSTREPLSSPGLHMIEVAPTVRICLMHVQDPSTCFSNRRLRRLSLVTDNLVEYVDMWCNALLAEACHDCVKTNKITILKDADLQWPNLVKSDTSIDRIYYTTAESLTLEICLEKYDMMDFVNIQVGDLVCACYEIQGHHEVYHFYVKKIEEPSKKNGKSPNPEDKSPGKMTIYFNSYGEHGCKVSQMMQELLKPSSKPRIPCDMQIIKSSISFRRVFQRLQCLKAEEYNKHKDDQKTEPVNSWTPLAKAVARVQLDLLRREPVLKNEYLEVFRKNPLARTLWETEQELNMKQMEAIESALKHKYQLIQGPPGTGKSITGAHLAYIFAITNRKNSENRQSVLYCGPSNKAVDVVHYQLIKVNKKLHIKKKLRILRLYGRAHETKDYPNPIMEVMGLDFEETLDSMCPEELASYALHHKIRQGKCDLKDMEEKLLSMKRDGKIPSLFERQKYNECLVNSEAEELRKSYDIILCTCNETCSGRLAKACSNQTLNGDKVKKIKELVISQCIVDECGMAHEPETIAAISRCDHAVLIGDHMQLQPVVKHSPAKACGLNRSLFQRYAELHVDLPGHDCLVKLDIQYRMHQYICQAPSDMFYEGKLRTDISVKKRKPLKGLDEFFVRSKNPVRFYDIEGKEESGMEKGDSHKSNIDVHSKCNTLEAEKAVELIQQIQGLVKTEVSIAVLTPYSAQKDEISKLLTKKKIRKVKVLSIVESQGDEYDVVIISTVRTLPRKQIKEKKYIQPDSRWKTENLGFLIDSHQLNVAITRAKHGLIIIGDQMLLRYDEDGWGKLIEKYQKDQLIVPIKPTKK